ncbi:MAG: tetratricopeptide repeat protein [Caldithrix sp.]|nr:tetratricopeptide repeat protein [Caldithrix sp.]
MYKSNLLITWISYAFLLLIMTACGAVQKQKTPSSQTAFRQYSNALKLKEIGQYQRALQEINEAIARNDRIANFQALKGDLLYQMGSDSMAIDAYEQALQLRKNNPRVHLQLADIYTRMGNHEQAVVEMREAFKQDNDHLQILVMMSRRMMDMNNLDEARLLLAQYRRQQDKSGEPLAAEYYRTRVKLYYLQNRYQEIADLYEDCPADWIKTREDGLIVLTTLLKLNRYPLAFRCLSQIDPHLIGKDFYHYFKGRYYFSIQNFDDALEQFELAKANGNATAELQEWMVKTRQQIQ